MLSHGGERQAFFEETRKAARPMSAMRRAILPISTKRLNDNARKPAIAMNEAFGKKFLPLRKSEAAEKRRIIAITPCNNLML